MDPEKQPVRKTGRIRKRTSKGEDADLAAKQDSPTMAAPKDDIHLDSIVKMAKRAAAPPPPANGADNRSRKSKKTPKRSHAAPRANGAEKPAKKSSASRRDTLLSAIDIDIDTTTPAQTTSHEPANEFDSFPIGTAVESFDDGADDDWEDFAGNADEWHGMISPGSPETIMAQAVARTFVSRARNAKGRNRTWKTFAEDERRINSSSATSEKGLKPRALISGDALDNGLRLAILDKIAARVCVEIFGETWTQYRPRRIAPTTSHDLPVRFNEVSGAGRERSTTGWEPGGRYGAVPLFGADDASVSSGEVELREEDWMPQEG